MDADETRSVRRKESQRAADILGATWYPPIADDLEIVYSVPLLRKLATVIRRARPRVVLTHSPQDYMIDHENTARLAVTAAFARGMPNFATDPPVTHGDYDVTVYHAMPHGLCDPLSRQPVTPDGFIDTSSVHDLKRQALAAHASQKEWLDASQGMDSYLLEMDSLSQAVGAMSGKFRHAEGWRRRSHLGFSSQESDPLAKVLGDFWCTSRTG